MINFKKTEMLRRPSAKLSVGQLELAKRYLQGAVHSFCKNNPGKAFSLRDLVGGENKDWGETPLQAIYEYHISTGKTKLKAKRQAAIDAGWLLKTVLAEDESRCFVQSQGRRTKTYCKVN
ncbi:MAG: hypothetical protein IJW41_02345 [Oscillospiraceae bacterium]|nr:hypothetical protein [Oscillospiraceae bacterium]